MVRHHSRYQDKAKTLPDELGKSCDLYGCSKLTSVEFDDLLLLEELRKIFSLWHGDDLSVHALNVRFDIRRNRSAFVVIVSSNVSARLSVSDLDDIADLQLEGSNIYNLTVDSDVAVADHLSGLENRLCVSESPDCSCKSELEEAKEVKRGVAAHSLSLLERVRELLLEHVVVTADDLFGQKLLAVFGLPSILQVWTVLTERVRALGYRAVWSTPNVVADSAADVCLSSSISCHF